VTRLFLALILLFSAQTSYAQNFPALTGRVVDAANIIPDGDEAAITSKLEALEKESGRQLVVATIADLQGYPIEDFGYQLGRSWAIGQKSQNNGALLIVAPNERKVRIEIGYGLEPIITDIYSGVIIRDVILPQFKAGEYPAGINAGTDALITQLRLPPDEAAKVAKTLADQERKGDSGGAVFFWLFIFFFFILPIIWPIFFGRGRGRRYGAGPVIIWGGGDSGGSSSWGSGGGFGGGFSGGGGSFGGGGSSGSW
jgi:uncharacterized protein